MVFKRTEFLRTITQGLSWIVTTCELQGLLKLFDHHVQVQHFCCRLLNSAYRLQLQKMDQIQANYPAIDLGDTSNRIAYQITTEKRGEKVQHTLDKFVKHDLANKYDILRILIIGERQATYRSVKIPSSLSFDCDRDIMGISELTKYLDTLPTPHLQEVELVFKEELTVAMGDSGGNIHLSGIASAPQKSAKEDILDWLHRNSFQAPLSQVLPQIFRLAQIIGNSAVEHWSRLELQGYYKEAGMRKDDVVPEYRTIVGLHFDQFNRPLRVPPHLHFVSSDRFRFGIGTLEEFAKQTEMQNIVNLDLIELIRKEFNVDVCRFCFNPITVNEIINAVRSQAMDRIRELEKQAQT